MVEELKLAIKVDDDAIEQSLLKQFANAEKMANKVVLTFNNIDLDDKAIEAKFKEMQKMAGKNPIDLSIDKSSIEMLSAISKQLGNIFDITKGKSIIDSSATVSEINKITQATKELNKAQTGSENIQSKSFTTKNKTEAYNQLKQTADTFKQFYGNEEAMHTKAGTEAAYAYYKAYEEALKKGVAESKLQRVTVDVNPTDSVFTADRISSTRIKEFADFEKYGEETTALSEEISYFEKRLLKFSEAYSQIQSKLGKAPITPEIIQNIEEYVRNLEIAEARTKDADLMGFTKEDIDLYKDSANMYLGFATEDAIRENEKYISSLKEVKEEKENVDASLSKSQISDMDSSLVEQQNKIQEELKETQKQAEQTSESLSKIGDIDKSNISSEKGKDVFQGDDKATTDASATAIKEESQVLEQVSTSAKDAATSKEKFANANKEVKASAESSSTSLNEEKKKIDNVGNSAEETKKKLDDVVFKPNTEGFDEIVSKLDIAKDKIEEISKITKSSVWSESQGEYLESYNIKYKNGTSEIRGESSNKKGSNVLRANEVAYDVKAAEQEAKERLKSEQKVQAQKDAFHKKNLTAIDLEIQKREEEAKSFSSSLKAQMEERQKDISSMESSLKSFNESSKQLSAKPDGQHQFSSWKKQLEDLNIKIAEYKNKVENLSKIDIADEEQIKKAKTEIEELGNRIKETITSMKNIPQASRGWNQSQVDKLIQRMNDDLKKNSNYTKETRRNIEGLIEELKNIPDRPLSEVFNDFSRFKREAHDARKEGKAFFEIFKEKVIYGGAAQLAGMFGFYDVINVGREIVTNIKEVDTALTELRKVSDATEQRLTTNFKNSADTAKELGATISDVISATADWSRMGYNIDQAEELARVSTLYKNVGDGIDIETANNSLISTLQGFQLDASEAESIIDKFNEVANNYAIDSAGIGEALQRSAASFNAANTDLSKSIALITATNEVVQDPDSVGTLWKTMSARIRGKIVPIYNENYSLCA